MCGIYGYLAFNSFESGQRGMGWILSCFALVYNPFVPLHLGEVVWSIVNTVALGILVSVNARSTNEITVTD